MNVEFLESISNLLTKNEETAWQKASASLDASAKIYGFRVDSVHSETFKFLGGLSRNDNKEDDNDEAGKDDDDNNNNKKEKIKRHNGNNTIEKDIKKLNLTKYDLEFEIDPLFKSMTAKFNEGGARGLLLNKFPLDENLDILLESKDTSSADSTTPSSSQELKTLPTCSTSPSDLTEETKQYINDFISKTSADQIISTSIANDFAYFKNNRGLEYSSNEGNFYQNFMHELDNENPMESIIDEQIEGYDDMNGNENGFGDNISIGSQNKSENENEFGSSQMNDDAINQFQDNNITIGGSFNTTSFMKEGFSMFKHEDILEHVSKFGDGSRNVLKNLPQFQNFMKAFNQLDKGSLFFNRGLALKNNNDISNKDSKKVKKEEKLFEFSIDKEVLRNEIFAKESKVKKYNMMNDTNILTKKEKKRKVKQLYNYDKYNLFKLFCIPERNIFANAIANNPNLSLAGDGLLDGTLVEGNDDLQNNYDEMPSVNADDNKYGPNSTFVRFDQEYEKKFGNLYKRIDIRALKKNIWETYEEMEGSKKQNKESIEFKTVINDLTKKMDKHSVDNITNSTCFVCMLHLCNEKSKLYLFL